ncbi:MAG: peptidoglycan DD-metalloendopeptidase family protein [Actinobacteria bacterium]|nr:peptidoglycan DD-metalloendopeptidase family protein [Actinomycetota bacterium]
MRLRVLVAGVLLPLALWAGLPMVSSGQSASQSELDKIQSRINKSRATIGVKRGRERVLTTQITGSSRRINRLAARQSTIEVDLSAKRSELERLRTDLRAERARIVRLRNRLAKARTLLTLRLQEIYKAGQPDIVTVILNSDGFADLLERAEFIKRISDQDRRVIKVVRVAKTEAVSSEKRLDRLESRQQTVTEIVLKRRDEVLGVKIQLLELRSKRSSILRNVRQDRKHLEQHVDDLESASAKIARQLGQISPGEIRGGNGPWIWPVNGPITGKFGEARPGHMHAGVDVAAASGTPIRAAANGKVVLMQGVGSSGGYGNYTCIQHTSSLASCYAHQSRFGTSLGASVKQGQVIGYVGNTGHSFGAHLHFEARVNGTPVQPLNYL